MCSKEVGSKVFRAYVSTTFSADGGLVTWVDEGTATGIVHDGVQLVSFAQGGVLSPIREGWHSSRQEADREIIKRLKDKAGEIMAQAGRLEAKMADSQG